MGEAGGDRGVADVRLTPPPGDDAKKALAADLQQDVLRQEVGIAQRQEAVSERGGKDEREQFRTAPAGGSGVVSGQNIAHAHGDQGEGGGVVNREDAATDPHTEIPDENRKRHEEHQIYRLEHPPPPGLGSGQNPRGPPHKDERGAERKRDKRKTPEAPESREKGGQ